MGNPYYDAQAQAGADPNNPGLSEGVPAVPTGSMQPDGMGAPAPAMPNYHAPTADEIGSLRDTLLAQFPELQQTDDAPLDMTPSQKLALFGMYLVNPKGTDDLIRQRRERQLKRQQLKAEMNLKMIGVAGSILKTQNEVEQQMLEARLALNKDYRDTKTQEFNEHIERAKLGIMQASAARAARKDADEQQFRGQFLEQWKNGGAAGAPAGGGVGVDAGGDPISTPDAAPAAAPSPQWVKSIGIGANGNPTLSMRQVPPPSQRSPQVDFDGWVAGLKSRYPYGLPKELRDPQALIEAYKRERAMLGGGVAPGSFGGLGFPAGGGSVDLFSSQPQDDEDAALLNE